MAVRRFSGGSAERLPVATKFRHAFALAAVSALIGMAHTQDSPSLGDLARQQRQQKEQSGKDAKAAKVITNADLPEHSAPSRSSDARGDGHANSMPAPFEGPKQPADHWQQLIVTQKNQINSLQRQVDEIGESIRFAPANCAANCVGWNERQREKQQRVERMQSQLEEEKRRLEALQDQARKQGYGSSVYDP